MTGGGYALAVTATTIIAGAVATFLSAIVLACLWAALSSAVRRQWRFAGGAALMAALFALGATTFWDAAITGRMPTADDDAPRLR